MKTISLSMAKALGLKRYFTGKLCKRWHTSERYVEGRGCIDCRKESLGLPPPVRPRPERCECCNGLPGKHALGLDHDHKTGKFRGWLCSNCNAAIGLLGDTIQGIDQAYNYLRRNT